MAGILKWEVWKDWFGGMGALRAQVSSVTQLCLTLCNPVESSMPGSLSFTISWSWLEVMSIELVMLSNHLILCCPLLPFAFNLSQHQVLFQ